MQEMQNYYDYSALIPFFSSIRLLSCTLLGDIERVNKDGREEKSHEKMLGKQRRERRTAAAVAGRTRKKHI